jgi:hypothetical protein
LPHIKPYRTIIDGKETLHDGFPDSGQQFRSLNPSRRIGLPET